MADKKSFHSGQFVVIVMIVSILTGGIAGGVVGFIAGIGGSNFSGSLQQTWLWFLGKQPTYQSVKINQPVTAHYENLIESQIVAAVENVSPSVVSVIVTKEIEPQSTTFNFPFDDFFGFPFEFDIPETPSEPELRQVGGGTGFVIDTSAGLILTNRHVVDDEGAAYSILTNKGQEFPATVLARDPFNDLAVVQVDGLELPEVSFGDSAELKLGQTVIAIGNSLGEFRNTVTTGVVSGIGRDIVAGGAGLAERLEDVIQTDAAINPGNSGGPLINLRGEVIGINTAVSNQGQLIGFAIPVNEARKVAESVKQYGRIVRPYLGVRYRTVNEVMAEQNELPVDHGALVVRGDRPSELAVIVDGPADKAGLLEGDIIIEVNGEMLTEDQTLSHIIQEYDPGDTVLLTVIRDTEELELEVTLEEFEQNE